jgi:hypothetical protein
VKKTFTIQDIRDQDKLLKDVKETTDRIVQRKQNMRGRTYDQVYENTKQGLVLEHYLLQEDPKYTKATDLDPNDVYHDLIDGETDLIHECKVIPGFKGWDDYNLAVRISKILKGDWNKSTYVHVADYDKKTGIYTYKGSKKIR